MLLGGGHAHVQVLRAIGMKPLPGVRVTVISRELESPYSGMLPGHVAGAYTRPEMHIDLAPLARFAGARLLEGEAFGLDVEQRRVLLSDHPPIRYDVLSINTGAVPDAPQDGVAVKPIGRFLPQWDAVRDKLPQGARVAVVGSGAGGVELALAIRAARSDLGITVYGRTWLPGFNASAAELIRLACEEQQVAVRVGEPVEPGAAELGTADQVFWVTGVRAPGWLGTSGVHTDPDGFVVVDETLRSTSHPEIFAAGDIACLKGQERPKAGVYAVRAGPVLVANLRAIFADRKLRRFRPQRHFLTLMGIGDGTAVAAKWQLATRSRWMWRWKDHIDRSFMRRFQNLPEMSSNPPALPPALAEDAPDPMRCGGCGAKLGADLLRRVLARLPISESEDVLVGIGDDAAEVRAGPSILVSTDGLRGMLDDTYRFGRIVAHHNLNDLFAMGAHPTSAVAMATVPLMAEPLMEDELLQLLLGVVHVLEAHDVALVGGHSSEGAELFLALTVMGGRGEHRFSKDGLRPGDQLILNKPIGTGVVLAAAMRGEAASADVARATRSMDTSNADAAAVLGAHGALGVTDVTGFGLAGHLSEMLRASQLGVTLQIDQVPALPGAQALLDQGLASALQGSNEQALQDFKGRTADARLLCDPQTSGGLLAGVAPDRAPACLEALRRAGYEHAAIIGTVEEGAWRLT